MKKRDAKIIALEEILNKINGMEISEYTLDRLDSNEENKVNDEIIDFKNALQKRIMKLEEKSDIYENKRSK